MNSRMDDAYPTDLTDELWVGCVEAVQAAAPTPSQLVMQTPQGRPLTQSLVQELSQQARLLLLCGRYEGFDG